MEVQCLYRKKRFRRHDENRYTDSLIGGVAQNPGSQWVNHQFILYEGNHHIIKLHSSLEQYLGRAQDIDIHFQQDTPLRNEKIGPLFFLGGYIGVNKYAVIWDYDKLPCIMMISINQLL